MLYGIILFLLLGDLLLFFHVLDEMFKWNDAIIGGVLGFIGAVLGGVITYIGVNKTIQHRNKEVFLETATEKLIIFDKLLQDHQVYLNRTSMIDARLNDAKKNEIIKGILLEFHKSIKDNTSNFYKSMKYEDVQVIMIYQKFMARLIVKNELNEEERADAIEKVQSTFKRILDSKKKLESKYYQYSKN